MGIDPKARQRWREWQIGDVPLRSTRGIVAASLIGLAVVAALLNPLVVTLAYFAGTTLESQEITLDLLIANFVFNTIVLVALPVAGLAVARPAKLQPPRIESVAAPASVQPSWTQVDPQGRPLASQASVIKTGSTFEAVVDRLGLGVDRRTPLWIVVGAGAALASLFALAGILYGLTELGMEAPEESPLIDEIDALLTWPLVFLIPLVAAVTEEVFFRGVLQPRVGLIASSVFFGIVHVGYGTWLQVVAPVLLGFLFGILFLRTRSLWTAIAAHYTFDFVQLLGLMLTQ